MWDTFDPPIPHVERLEKGLLGREAKLLIAMAEYYCQKTHKTNSLCDDCRQHLRYSLARLACCPYGEEKPTCAKCVVRCHKSDEKAHIKDVMKTSGAPMLLYHPILTSEHLLRALKKAPPHPRELRKKVKDE